MDHRNVVRGTMTFLLTECLRMDRIKSDKASLIELLLAHPHFYHYCYVEPELSLI